MKKSIEEIKKLQEEISALRQENIQLKEEALRQKRLAAAATNRPEASSVPPISSSESLTVTATSPDQVRHRKHYKPIVLKLRVFEIGFQIVPRLEQIIH